MHVHAAAGLPCHGLGEEGGGAPLPHGLVFDHVLSGHGVVGHAGHLAQLYLNLHLAAAAHLGVVVLHLDTPLLQEHADAAAEVLGDVLGQGGVVAGFLGDLVAVVFAAPLGLAGVDAETGGLRLGGVLHPVKDIELILRAHDHLVGDAQLLHVGDGPLGHVPGILAKGAVGRAVDDHHIPDHGEGGHLPKGVHHRSVQIGHENHVAALDGGVSVVGPVKPNAVLHGVLVEPADGDAQMTPPPVDVRHLEVDHFDVFFLTQV